MTPIFSIVLPIYKNEQNLPVTIPYILEHMDLFPDYQLEVIMVNDGSPDNSYQVMKEYQQQYPDIIKIASLTRNFGQAAACCCGISLASGDVIGVISADLQDPFELFADMLKEWQNGSKLVIATRKDRTDKGLASFGGKIFHGLMHRFVDKRYPKGGFDFYLMDRQVANDCIKLDNPYFTGQFPKLWLGYPYKQLTYVRKEREIGSSGYSILKKGRLAVELMSSNSKVLLNLLLYTGVLLFLFGILSTVFNAVLFHNLYWGIFSLLSFFSAGNFIALSILGNYLWKIFDLEKGKPRFVIDEVIPKRDI